MVSTNPYVNLTSAILTALMMGFFIASYIYFKKKLKAKREMKQFTNS